jgi:hypothetical protein
MQHRLLGIRHRNNGCLVRGQAIWVRVSLDNIIVVDD